MSQEDHLEGLSPHKRKRLDAMFEAARKRASGSKPDYDYAAKLLTDCVLGDPANTNYVKEHLETLQKKYDNNRTGASLGQIKGMGARSALKKSLSREAWDEVIKNGLKVLEINPWDASALAGMAMASKKLGFLETDPARRTGYFDVEFFYLKAALPASPKDKVVNRLLAAALTERGNYDQAIVCWHRVELADPKDEEAKRAIAVLQTKKMKLQDGFEDEEERKIQPKFSGAGAAEVVETVSPEKRLLEKIKQEPDTQAHYFDLSQLYIKAERYADAERILTKAYELSKQDPDVREKLEDAQIRRLRQAIAQAGDSDKKHLLDTYYRKELEVWQNRCERYPGNLVNHYELGYRYLLTKQYQEAIRELQSARNEPSRKGACYHALGVCFQHINQFALAKKHFQQAIAEIPDRDANMKKKALYSAGHLGLQMHDIETAEKYLTTLAGMDFTYKDVPKLLDKIARFHQNQKDQEKMKRPPDQPHPPEEGMPGPPA
jgi:tetratricopeptide (TPR) repeat protein